MPTPENGDPATTYRRRPGDVLAAVELGLRELGLTRLYLVACPLVGVLSVAAGVTAWCDGRTLRWRHAGQETIWPVADAAGAARRLAELASETGTRHKADAVGEEPWALRAEIIRDQGRVEQERHDARQDNGPEI